MTETAPHYRRPGWFTQHVFNPTVAGLTRLGISVWGSRVLEVKGRTSGTPRRVPVNLLHHDGHEYLVSPRGEGQWVRNVRAAGGNLDLLLGRKRQHRVATEIADADKIEILRAYLKRWKAEVGVFFDGTSAPSTDEQLLAIAPKHPVFMLDDAAQERVSRSRTFDVPCNLHGQLAMLTGQADLKASILITAGTSAGTSNDVPSNERIR